MSRIKPRGRYLSISVPIELHSAITEHIKKFTYNSVAEFVKQAVRLQMDLDNGKIRTGGFALQEGDRHLIDLLDSLVKQAVKEELKKKK